MAAAAPPAAVEDEWPCSVCTMLNDKSTEVCMICGSHKGAGELAKAKRAENEAIWKEKYSESVFALFCPVPNVKRDEYMKGQDPMHSLGDVWIGAGGDSTVHAEGSIKKSPAFLVAKGITHVVNCACLEIKYQWDPKEAGVTVIGIPLTDASELDTKVLESSAEDAIDSIAEAVASGKKVLVHCAAGLSRSATVLILYLMKHKGCSLLEAFGKVRSVRRVYPIEFLMKYLIEWEWKNKGEPSVPREAMEMFP